MTDTTAPAVTYYDLQHAASIWGRMRNEHAADLSDAEIIRTLSPCVCGPSLVKSAQRLSAAGIFQLTDEWYANWPDALTRHASNVSRQARQDAMQEVVKRHGVQLIEREAPSAEEEAILAEYQEERDGRTCVKCGDEKTPGELLCARCGHAEGDETHDEPDAIQPEPLDWQ